MMLQSLFFRHFRDGDRDYLTRTWLIDPQQPEKHGGKGGGKKKGEPWNGRDFYVGIGESHGNRDWEDCQRYGFVSGGGGKWYSQTLNLLFQGARVFAMIPKTGYVGVGIVQEPSVPVKEFKVVVDGQQIPILDAPLVAKNMGHDADDLENCDYLVRVEWIKTVAREEAYWEKGLFAKQHTCCRLRNRFTLERLVRHFDLDE